MQTSAGGIPLGIPASTFVPGDRTKNSFVCIPDTGFPWRWTASAYLLTNDHLKGPYWPFIDPHDTRGTQLLVSGVGEQKTVLLMTGLISSSSSTRSP